MEEMVLGMMVRAPPPDKEADSRPATQAYINKMVHTIRPRKVLFVAIDGCAPRAKMNQQRSRRFASARDAKLKRDEAVANGEITLEDSTTMFDSNVITPGTAFMAELSTHFEFFLRQKLRDDPVWAGLEIVYSGHDVPGEGEHKIMDYIRHTRMQPGYDANTRHCLCGLDADLIMLGLASHEPHFSLLREEVDFNAFRDAFKKNATKQVKKQTERDKWQLLHLSTLRAYLELEFCPAYLNVDLERVVDDWVFMVMLVGNDFLPHLPSLDIHEGALDTLSQLYKELLPTLGGYLVENNVPQWDRVEVLLRRLGDLEESVLAEREQELVRRQQRDRRFHGSAAPVDVAAVNDDDVSLLDEDLEDDGGAGPVTPVGSAPPFSERKLLYYKEKFGVEDAAAENQVVSFVVRKYKEGLEWCLRYYYQGVPSWTWFYPFHFAPMASDLVNLSSLAVALERGAPFPPFMQLLSCLPSASAHCLPAPYRALMTDPDSPIADFYPTDWDVDENGKTSTWLFVNLLPFIDEERLRDAVVTLCRDEDLTEAERARNTFGYAKLIRADANNRSPLVSTLKALRSVDEALTSVSRYVLPAMDTHVPTLLPGVRALPGDPQLRLLVDPLMCELERVELDTFGARPSKKETFCLGLVDSPDSAAGFVAQLKHRSTVWIDFPYLREALVVAVADDVERIDKVSGARRQHTTTERNAFRQDAAGAEARALSGAKVVGTGGVRTGEVKTMVLVKPLCAMVEDRASGLRSRSFHASAETWVPAALCALENPLPDPRFQDSPAVALTLRFPVGMPVMCVQNEGYGMLGVIEAHTDKAVVARFPAKMAKPVEFGHVIATTMVETFVSLARAAQSLSVPATVLDKLFGSIQVMPGRVDLGLNLRVGADRVLPGYSRSTRTEQSVWVSESSLSRVAGFEPVRRHAAAHDVAPADTFEYSSRAIELAAKYKSKFPRLVEALARRPGEREYRAVDLFGRTHEADMAHVTQWLQQVPTYKLGLIPTSSKMLSHDAVMAVEAAAESRRRRKPPRRRARWWRLRCRLRRCCGRLRTVEGLLSRPARACRRNWAIVLPTWAAQRCPLVCAARWWPCTRRRATWKSCSTASSSTARRCTGCAPAARAFSCRGHTCSRCRRRLRWTPSRSPPLLPRPPHRPSSTRARPCSSSLTSSPL